MHNVRKLLQPFGAARLRKFYCEVKAPTYTPLASNVSARTALQTMLVSVSLVWGLVGAALGQGTTQVFGWGLKANGQTYIPTDATDATQISAGRNHNLALKGDGTLQAWGDNTRGQCIVPSGLSGIAQIAAGGYHNVVLKAIGSIYAWGDGSEGQCTVPNDIVSARSVTAGGAHSLALQHGGTLRAWGRNIEGQCSPPADLKDVTQVAAGWAHTAALKNDGTVQAWGSNYESQCNVPAGLTGVTQIAAGGYHNLALRADGTVLAWGSNYDGQCNVPAALTGVTQVKAGGYHSLVLKADGSPVSWGQNKWGQCSGPTTGHFSGIAAGGFHSLAWIPWSDCNGNGVFDGDDIASGRFADNDRNGQPDVCQGLIEYFADSGELGPPNPVKPATITFGGVLLADADVTLFITATGDFDANNEYLTVRLADSSNPLGYITLGRLFEVGGRNCLAGNNAATLTVPKDTFNRLAASGQLTIILVPSPPVTLGECPNGSMNVTLNYFGIGPDGDCDHDGRLDVRQIGEDRSIDSNLNSRIDNCEYAKGDFDLNGEVDTADLSLALLYLGELDSPFGDLDGDGTVTTADVSLLLMNFGSVVWP